MCPKHFLKPKNDFMSFEMVKKILDEARAGGCYAVNLNGAGESMCHPDLIEIIRYAKNIGFLDIMFHSNGTLLDEAMSRQLIKAGLTRMIVSLDSHIPEIYKQIRPSFDFETVYENVKKFIQIRNETGKREPLVRITMVVMKQNVSTIQETINFWNFTDYITINDCMYFDKFKVFEFNKDEISTKAKKEGMIYACAPLYQQLSVTTDLKVISCSTIYAKNYRILGDYTKQGL
ncbi:MAG: radical SAM protein, partial [Bacteroidia bacterium]|nr:radical SAM protein [Bacteroidia bacterium]